MSYAGDVSDAEWDEIKDFFIPEHSGRSRKWEDAGNLQRHSVCAANRMLMAIAAERLSPLSVVYMTLYRQRQAGVWSRINAQLRRKVREQAGKSPEPSVAALNSQTVKTVQKKGRVVSIDSPIPNQLQTRQIFVDGGYKAGLILWAQAMFSYVLVVSPTRCEKRPSNQTLGLRAKLCLVDLPATLF